MSNAEITTASKPKFSVAINTPKYQRLIANTLGDVGRAKSFTTAIVTAVGQNPELQRCEINSIVAAALLGEALKLSPSPQLGQYYLVPFEVQVKDQFGNKLWQEDENGNKRKDSKGKWIPVTETKAQFIMGYKGYVQLALRSGHYRKINVIAVKQGEYIGYNPFTEELECSWISDIDKREAAVTVGYAATIEDINGFAKTMYWTKSQMINHADTYVPGFSGGAYQKLCEGVIPESERWKYTSRWYKDFDTMAKKTMLRQIIGKWGMMSPDFQTAYIHDARVISVDGDNKFRIDNNEAPILPIGEPIKPEAEGIVEKINLDDV